MNHQAIEFLARDRIRAHVSEAASNRLAREAELRPNARWRATSTRRDGSLRAFVSRAGALYSIVRAGFARPGGLPTARWWSRS